MLVVRACCCCCCLEACGRTLALLHLRPPLQDAHVTPVTCMHSLGDLLRRSARTSAAGLPQAAVGPEWPAGAHQSVPDVAQDEHCLHRACMGCLECRQRRMCARQQRASRRQRDTCVPSCMPASLLAELYVPGVSSIACSVDAPKADTNNCACLLLQVPPRDTSQASAWPLCSPPQSAHKQARRGRCSAAASGRQVSQQGEGVAGCASVSWVVLVTSVRCSSHSRPMRVAHDRLCCCCCCCGGGGFIT
jgi:hypothetical protein